MGHYSKGPCLAIVALFAVLTGLDNAAIGAGPEGATYAHPPWYSFKELTAEPKQFDGKRLMVVGGVKSVGDRV